MRHNLLEAILGAIVLCFAGYFLMFAYKSGHSSSNIGYAIFAKFDRIDGLVVGNDIKISGVKIGTVQKIEVEPKSYRAKVTMKINKDVQVPSDSSAEIVSESLLGGKYIAIVPGINQKTLLADGRIAKTQSSVNLESLLSKFIFNNEKSSDDKNSNKVSSTSETSKIPSVSTSNTNASLPDHATTPVHAPSAAATTESSVHPAQEASVPIQSVPPTPSAEATPAKP